MASDLVRTWAVVITEGPTRAATAPLLTAVAGDERDQTAAAATPVASRISSRRPGGRPEKARMARAAYSDGAHREPALYCPSTSRRIERGDHKMTVAPAKAPEI